MLACSLKGLAPVMTVLQSFFTGSLHCREAIKPWDPPSNVPTYLDAFGLLNVTKPTRVGKDVGRKSHVLVCAPSNSALDEIVLRLISTGLLDE